MKILPNPAPLFSSQKVLINFVILVLCAQFAFSVLAMKGALLPQMLELWQISKTQFGVLMSIYGIVHNIFYVAGQSDSVFRSISRVKQSRQGHLV